MNFLLLPISLLIVSFTNIVSCKNPPSQSATTTTITTVLSSNNFEEFVGTPSKAALVMVYADWCGHCKHLKPEFDKLAAHYKEDSRIVIGKLDGPSNRALAKGFGVTGFPTIFYFAPGVKDEPEKVKAGRTFDTLKPFLDVKLVSIAPVNTTSIAQTSPQEPVQLSAENFKKIALDSEKDVFVKFTTPWCPHCKTVDPLFKDLINIYKDDDNIVIATVDLTKDQDIGVEMGITGLPTMMLFSIHNKKKLTKDQEQSPKDFVTAFQGQRDLPSMVQFLNDFTEAKRDLDGSLSTTHGVSELFDLMMDDFLGFKMGSQEQKEFAEKLGSDNAGDSEISIVSRALIQLNEQKGLDFIKKEYERLNKLVVADKVERYMNLFFIARRNILRRIIQRMENDKVEL